MMARDYGNLHRALQGWWRRRDFSLQCVVMSRSYTYSYKGVCSSLCADARCYDISTDQTSRERKKKGGKRPKPLPPEVHTDYTGHPYSSGIYEVLRMDRKLTKPKSWYSGGVLMFSYGNKRVGVSRKNGPRSNVCLKSVMWFVIFLYGWAITPIIVCEKLLWLLDGRLKEIYKYIYEDVMVNIRSCFWEKQPTCIWKIL